MKKTLITTAIATLALGAAFASPASAQDKIGACLITKTDTNPFFVKMKEGATAKAEELGIELKSFAGKIDGDHETQVAAIETCIADGAKGILLTASDTSSIVSSVQQARDAGLLVIALDTPLDPIDAADMTFATDNFKAGELIGQWAAAKLGDDAANAKIGMLDLAVSQPTVGVLRDQGHAPAGDEHARPDQAQRGAHAGEGRRGGEPRPDPEGDQRHRGAAEEVEHEVPRGQLGVVVPQEVQRAGGVLQGRDEALGDEVGDHRGEAHDVGAGDDEGGGATGADEGRRGLVDGDGRDGGGVSCHDPDPS